MTQLTFSQDELKLLREQNMNLSDSEFGAFTDACKRYQLNPIANQMYAQVRGKEEKRRVTFVTGIDGYRLCADRSGAYAGNDDPVFDEFFNSPDGKEIPGKAVVTVYKVVAGVRCPFTSSARWDQYYPGKGTIGFMWRKMPHLMLGKCAEALALRKAFPAELSGIYTAEEMEQAGEHEQSGVQASDHNERLTADLQASVEDTAPKDDPVAEFMGEGGDMNDFMAAKAEQLKEVIGTVPEEDPPAPNINRQMAINLAQQWGGGPAKDVLVKVNARLEIDATSPLSNADWIRVVNYMQEALANGVAFEEAFAEDAAEPAGERMW